MTTSKTMLLDIPSQINKLGTLVYQAITNQSNPQMWELVKSQCHTIYRLLNKFIAGELTAYAFTPSELQDVYRPFIGEIAPNFESVRRHLSQTSFLRLVEEAYVEAQAVLLLKTPEGQKKGIQCLLSKIHRFEHGAHHRFGLAERIQEARCDVRKNLVAMPNVILEIARLVQAARDKENKIIWGDIGLKIQEVMGIATYLQSSTTQLTFNTSDVGGIDKPDATVFDSTPESSFILTVLQDAWQTAKELLILQPHKQRESLSRVYSRMDRISTAVLPLFNHAMALKRAGDMHATTLAEREARRNGVKEPETKKRKITDVESTPPETILPSDSPLINRCYTFLRQTGIWRLGDQSVSKDAIPSLNHTLLEVILVAVHVRMRVTCARFNPKECGALVNHGLAALFPDTKPETVEQVTLEEWDRFDADVNALCVRVM